MSTGDDEAAYFGEVRALAVQVALWVSSYVGATVTVLAVPVGELEAVGQVPDLARWPSGR